MLKLSEIDTACWHPLGPSKHSSTREDIMLHLKYRWRVGVSHYTAGYYNYQEKAGVPELASLLVYHDLTTKYISRFCSLGLCKERKEAVGLP